MALWFAALRHHNDPREATMGIDTDFVATGPTFAGFLADGGDGDQPTMPFRWGYVG
jgi:hypothetical protein